MEFFYNRLKEAFETSAPNASHVYDLLDPDGRAFDHVAFRTLSEGEFTLDVLDAWLKADGYVITGEYRFKEKHLRARSYSNTDSRVRRIFLSELLVDELTEKSQAILRNLSSYRLPFHVIFPFCQNQWPKINPADYHTLLQESDYAAWVVTNGLMPNHLAMSVDKRIADVVSDLESQGFTIASSGGKVKGGPALLLEQGSTPSDTKLYEVDGVTLFVPTAYCEFTKRWLDPKTGHLFDAFVEPNANKIFESTDLRPVERALAIVKPDATRRGLTNQVLMSLISEGLEVVQVKRTFLNHGDAEQLYAVHKGKSFYEGLIEFMTSGNLSLVEVRGHDCSKRLRKVVAQLRSAFAMSTSENVVHGSDSVENGYHEVGLFFPSNT